MIAKLLATLGLFGALSATALAADLPNIKEAPADVSPPPAFNWTGFYLGINGGYGLDHFAFLYEYVLAGGWAPGTSGIDSRGAIFGGQVGYNYQFSDLPFIGHAVVGIEADADWSGIRGTTAVATPVAPLLFGTKFENFGTLRGRLGYNFDRTLLYFTGGLTYSTVQTSYVADGAAGSITVTRAGVFPHVGVIGAGAEYAFTGNVSAKAEYLYDFTGARYEQFYPTSNSRLGFGTRSMYHIARVGLNYRFSSQ